MFVVGSDSRWHEVCGNQNGHGVGFSLACSSQERLSSVWIVWNRWWVVMIPGSKTAEKKCAN